jgi:hypothetical protein
LAREGVVEAEIGDLSTLRTRPQSDGLAALGLDTERACSYSAPLRGRGSVAGTSRQEANNISNQ